MWSTYKDLMRADFMLFDSYHWQHHGEQECSSKMLYCCTVSCAAITSYIMTLPDLLVPQWHAHVSVSILGYPMLSRHLTSRHLSCLCQCRKAYCFLPHPALHLMSQNG